MISMPKLRGWDSLALGMLAHSNAILVKDLRPWKWAIQRITDASIRQAENIIADHFEGRYTPPTFLVLTEITGDDSLTGKKMLVTNVHWAMDDSPFSLLKLQNKKIGHLLDSIQPMWFNHRTKTITPANNRD